VTVQQLIDELVKVEDKNLPVGYYAFRRRMGYIPVKGVMFHEFKMMGKKICILSTVEEYEKEKAG